MSDYKDLLGALSVCCALIAYVKYLRDIFVLHTKPHAFSWLIWSVLGGIAFAAQFVSDAGAGSWVTFTDVFLCFIVFVLALFRGEKSYSPFDWVSLFLAFFSLLLWWITKTPTLSVILVTFIDYCAFMPTFRKSYSKPWEETASMYFLSSLKYTLAAFALSSYSLSSALYVTSLIPINFVLATMILLRRKQLKSA